MVEPHTGDVPLALGFRTVYDWLLRNGPAALRTHTRQTPFRALAATVQKGPRHGERVIRIFQHETEYARAYECCWGWYYNCNRTRIGMYCEALDTSVAQTMEATGGAQPATAQGVRAEPYRAAAPPSNGLRPGSGGQAAKVRQPIVVAPEKLEAAARLYSQLEGWRTAAMLLDELRTSYPSNEDFKAVLLKASALNQLYGTNVYAIYDMARHICKVARTSAHTMDLSLVQQLAVVQFDTGRRRFVSFASKYAHFFVDPVFFPVLDSYAAWALAVHLGESKSRSEQWRKDYLTFCRELDLLRMRDGITVSLRELDKYLWLYGAWLSHRAGNTINKELIDLIKQDPPDLGVFLSSELEQ